MTLYVQEMSTVEYDDGRAYRIGESDVYEAYTDDRRRLFRDMQREYGRCTGKVYIDTPDKQAMAIGWVFAKRRPFERDDGSYLASTWVTLHSQPPTRTTAFHYVDIEAKQHEEEGSDDDRGE